VTFGLVIFDCDGVLVDSEPVVNRAHAELLNACGYRITTEQLVERFCGFSDPEMLAIIEREWGRALPPSYLGQVYDIVERSFEQSLTAMPGIFEALDALHSPLCVASSSAPRQLRQKLELSGLLTRFGENLFTASMVARGKPAPDLFLHAARSMAAMPDHCVVVEDSPAGIDAAVAAGMAAIGFCGGSHCRSGHAARLRARGAALAIAEMRELPAALAALYRLQ
jgi:HAD superfamily hydrolase (TIGR01509 family)